MNSTTHWGDLSTFFWFNFSFLLFFIIAWVIQIAAWIIYIQKKLRTNHKQKQLCNDESYLKNNEVEEWKLKLMKRISFCEILALISGAAAICLHRIITFQHNSPQVELALAYAHDMVYFIGLNQIWIVLGLLNTLVRYLRGVFDWHMYKPDVIKEQLEKIKGRSLTVIVLALPWVTVVPLSIIMYICIIWDYVLHIKYSIELNRALKLVTREWSLITSPEGRIIHKIKQREQERYGLLTTLIIVGMFFWIAPNFLSINKIAINQIEFVAKSQGINIKLFDYIHTFKLYLISFTDILLIIGGAFLFPVHICYGFGHLKWMRLISQLCCSRKTNRNVELTRPLV